MELKSLEMKRFNLLVEEVVKSAKKRNDAYVGKVIKVLVEGVSKRNQNILSGTEKNQQLRPKTTCQSYYLFRQLI